METNLQNGGIINQTDYSGFTNTCCINPTSNNELFTLINTIATSHLSTPAFKSYTQCDDSVKLQAEYCVDKRLIREQPEYTDKMIREELARKLANMMIEEDLIKIQYTDDPAELECKYCATVKIIQE